MSKRRDDRPQAGQLFEGRVGLNLSSRTGKVVLLVGDQGSNLSQKRWRSGSVGKREELQTGKKGVLSRPGTLEQARGQGRSRRE